MFEEKFKYHFKSHDIGFDEQILKDFYRFTNFLLSENEKYNLTAIKDIDEIIVKHYIDSIMPLKYFDIPLKSHIIDVGTGAGFPAVPLYIMRKDLHINFMDSSNKKIDFVCDAVKNISGYNKENFFFLTGRAEEYAKDFMFREEYDFVLSRAVARLNVLCELISPLVKKSGYLIAYKGKSAEDEVREAQNAFKTLNLEIADAAEFNLNLKSGNIDDNKRVLLKIRKLKETSPEYPRNFSVITKKPL